MKRGRFDMILSLLNKNRYMSVEEMSQVLFVSPSTLRRDLNEMAKSGFLLRTHGGAMALTPGEAEETVVHFTSEQLSHEQISMARTAAELIRDGDIVYLDASRLILGMVPFLQDKKRLTIITNSLQIVLSLPEGRHHVLSLGGRLVPQNLSVSGRLAVTSASRFNYNIAFFSCSGISSHHITCRSMANASLMQEIALHAHRSILLCSRTKAERTTAINAMPISRVSAVITDAPEFFVNEDVEIVRVKETQSFA